MNMFIASARVEDFINYCYEPFTVFKEQQDDYFSSGS
jgi:hypothetical protein